MNLSGSKSFDSSQIKWPAATLLVLAAAFVLAKAGRDSLYFRREALQDLPWAYLGIATLSIPLSAITLGLMRLLGARCTVAYAPLVMGLVQLAFWPVMTPGGGWLMTLFFMLIPLGYGILFSLSWLHASEFVDRLASDDRSWVYGVLGATPMLGGLIGATVAKSLATRVAPQWLVLISSFGLVLCAVLVLAGQRVSLSRRGLLCTPCARGTRGAGQMPPQSETRAVLRHPFARRLLAVAMTATAAGVLIEFQFYAAAAASVVSQTAISDLFANFYLALSGMALIIQLLMTPPLQRRFGIGGNLIILPSVLLGGAAVMVLSASGLVLAALRVTEGSLKASIHRSSWEQAYLPLPRDQRRTAKVLIDAMAVHVAEGLTAVFLLLGLSWFTDPLSAADALTTWITYTLVVTAGAWVLLAINLRRRLLDIRARPIEDDEDQGVSLPDCCAATVVLGDEIRRSAGKPMAEPETAPQIS